jgi:hypothetical protein
MKAKRFVETSVASMTFAWRRSNTRQTMCSSASEYVGPVVRIVWAVIEVIPLRLLTDKDLAPGLPPSEKGWEGWDLRLDRLTFAQGPTAELADLDDAKPSGLEDSPAVLVSYPGRVSWEKARQTSERLLR